MFQTYLNLVTTIHVFMPPPPPPPTKYFAPSCMFVGKEFRFIRTTDIKEALCYGLPANAKPHYVKHSLFCFEIFNTSHDLCSLISFCCGLVLTCVSLVFQSLSYFIRPVIAMGLLPDTKNCVFFAHALECRDRFPRHHGLGIPACITARTWRTCRDACRDR